MLREVAKKVMATKRGGGVRALPLIKKNFFEALFKLL